MARGGKQPRLAYLDLIKARGKSYAYYRRDGCRQRIEGEIGSPDWHVSYERIHRSFERQSIVGRAKPETLATLIEDYLGSPRFTKLASGTKASYRITADKLRANLGTASYKSITRGVVVAMRDKVAQTKPKAALELVKVLRVVFEHAIDCDLVDRNPCSGVSKPVNYDPEPHRPWTDDEIEQFKALAKPIWRRAMMILLCTGLRRGDAIELRRSDIVDGEINWVVQKTSTSSKPTEVTIPVHSEMLDELARPMPVESVYLMINAKGAKMTGFGVSQGLMRECRRLGFDPSPPLHGLRKNAIMRLIEAGAEAREIQAITGQSLPMIEHYGKAYKRRKLARAAVFKLERAKR